jgi:hypothetical protein
MQRLVWLGFATGVTLLLLTDSRAGTDASLHMPG